MCLPTIAGTPFVVTAKTISPCMSSEVEEL